MRYLVWSLLLLGVIMIPFALQAQTDTIVVTSDLTTSSQGNLNTAINNVIQADSINHTNKFSNTVFMLQPYGYYILTGTITTPAHSKFYLEGPVPGNDQQSAPAQIVWSSSGGVSTTYNFDCYGDLYMKNIWILCATSIGSQVGSSLVIEDDSLANLSGKGEIARFNNVIFDYQPIGNGGGEIEPACRHFRCTITNTYFRNFTDPHYRYYGRPVSWTYQSTTWHTDSLTFENCTFSNCGYCYMQESPEYADYVWYNHCTFSNSMMFTLESSYWWWLSVTNCVFVNSFMYGDIPSADGSNQTPSGGAVNIDSTATFGFGVPFVDSSTAAPARQRHILFANNSYGFESWYPNFLAHNAYNDTASAANKINVMPMFSGKTYRYFMANDSTGQKRFKYISVLNLIPSSIAADTARAVDPSADPGFILNPCNIDSIKAFLLGRWATGANVSWAYDPASDVQQVWPMNEDYSYTNNTIMTAGMGGFPLGDLYHWWKSQYTTWSGQSGAEHTKINDWLTNGVTLGVKEQTFVPGTFDLAQNYPNPFNPSTKIEYSIAKAGQTTLRVYNILGEEVATLYSGVQQPGHFTATFDGSRFASGVYFYRLQSGTSSLTKKFVLMK